MHSSSSNLCVRKNQVVNIFKICPCILSFPASFFFQIFFFIFLYCLWFKDQPFKSVISSLVLNVGRIKDIICSCFDAVTELPLQGAATSLKAFPFENLTHHGLQPSGFNKGPIAGLFAFWSQWDQ